MYKYLRTSIGVCVLSSLLALLCQPEKSDKPADRTPWGQPGQQQEDQTTDGSANKPIDSTFYRFV